MIYLIALGLLQTTILPGMAVCCHVKSLSVSQKLIVSSFLSVLINYSLVLTLSFFNIYTQKTMVWVGVFEIAIILCHALRNGIFKNLIRCISRQSIDVGSSRFFCIAAIILYCSLYYTFALKNFSVFTEWDAVVSWNRWAEDWYYGVFNGSSGYPQGLPILLSVVYKLANTTNIQTFSKLLCGYLPFVGGLALYTALKKYYTKPLVSVAGIFIYLYLISGLSDSFIFSGYVDPIMAAYGCFAIYVCAELENLKNTDSSKLIWLPFALLGASLFKMTGVLLLFFTLLYVTTRIKWKNRPSINIKFLIVAFVCLALSVHWYLYSLYKYNDYPVAAYNSLQNTSYLMRPYETATLVYQNYSLIFSLLLCVGFLKDNYSRSLLCFIGIPLFIFASVSSGYDMRSSFVALPFLAICAGYGFTYSYDSIKRFHFAKVSITVFLIFYALFSISNSLNDSSIIDSNTKRRLAANDVRGLNYLISDTFLKNEKTVSCWQLPYGLIGGRDLFQPRGDCTMNTVEFWIDHKEIKNFLYWVPDDSAKYPSTAEVQRFLDDRGVSYTKTDITHGFFMFSK